MNLQNGIPFPPSCSHDISSVRLITGTRIIRKSVVHSQEALRFRFPIQRMVSLGIPTASQLVTLVMMKVTLLLPVPPPYSLSSDSQDLSPWVIYL